MSESEKYQKMAERKQWRKLQKKMAGTKEERLMAIAACGIPYEEEACNLLIGQLTACDDREIKLATIQSLGLTRSLSAVEVLSWLAEDTDDETIKSAICEAQTKIWGRKH